MTARVITLGDEWGKGGTPAQRALARQWIEEWRPLLFLQAFTIHVELSNAPCASEPAANADVSFLLEYHQARVTIYPKFWHKLTTDDERRFFLLHELCHRFTKKLRTLAFDAINEKLVRSSEVNDADEMMTDLIAKVLWHATDGGRAIIPTNGGHHPALSGRRARDSAHPRRGKGKTRRS